MDTTKGDVFSKLEDRRDTLQGLHQQMAIDELFIAGSAVLGNADLMQYLRGFPEGFIARSPPIAIDAVQRLRNQIITGETPDPKVLMADHHRGPEKENREKDDRLELQRYLKDELEHLDGGNGDESVFLTIGDHILGLGMAVLAYPFVKGRIPANPFFVKKTGLERRPRTPTEERKQQEYQRVRRGAIPFDLKPVHPVCAYFDIYHQPQEDMITEEEVKLGTLAERFPHLSIPVTSYHATEKLVSFCSAKEYGYWLGDKALLLPKDGANGEGIAPNPTGVLWYQMARSGFGFRTSKGDWADMIQGVIRGARPVILSLITDYNVQEIMKLLYVWPEEEFEVTTEQGRLDLDAYERGPGAGWVHGTGVRKLPTDATQIPNWAFEIQSLNSSVAEAHLGSKVLSGVDEDDTLGGLRTRVGLAQAPTRITKRALERMWAKVMMDMLWIQKHHLGVPLSIPTAGGYEDFDAKRIPDSARIVMDLTPATKEEISFQLEDLLKRKQAGAASTRRMLELDPEVTDVEDELINIDADAIMAMGETLQTASAEANRRFQQRIGAVPPEAPVPQGLPGDAVTVGTVGSPQDIGMQQQMARNGTNVAPPPLR